MNNTLESVVSSNSYLKKKSPPLDWNRSIEGTNFHQRSNNWLYEKEKKLKELKHMLSDRETHGCTFKPNTQRNSPNRRMKIRNRNSMKSLKTANVSSSPSRAVQGVYLGSPI
mmetsp:Transcript_2990/g.2470  ORF Transcript_2990/g.2470 Transcript_2990/m.2470 type:complete len:112 (+) Transcript_2990:153-488(+)